MIERYGVAMADRNVLLVPLVGAIFGGSFLFMRVAAPEVGGVTTSAGRILIAALVLAVVVGRPTLRAAWADRGGFMLLGLFQVAIPFTLIAVAETELTASLGAVLNATVPMFAALIGAAWFGTPVRPRVVGALGLGFAGVVVAVGGASLAGGGTPLAVLAMLGACGSYGIAMNYARRRFTGVPPMTVAVGQLIAAAALVLPAGLATLPPAPPSPAALGSIVALGVLCTAVAWPLLFRVLARHGATAASTVTFVIPVFGMLWGGIFLGERPGLELLLGAGLIGASLGLIFDVRPAAILRRQASAAA